MTEIIIAVLLGLFVVATGIFSLVRFSKDMKFYGNCSKCGAPIVEKGTNFCDTCRVENGGEER